MESISNWFPKLSTQFSYSKLSEPQVKLSPQMSILGSMFPPTLTSDKLYTGNITISELIFSSGKVFSAYKISELNYKIAQQEYEKVKTDVAIQYKEVFYKTLLAKKVVEVTQKAVEISSENYKISQQLYEEGRVSYLDFSSSKINFLNTQANLLKVKNNYSLAKEQLKTILCVDFEVEPVGQLEEFLSEDNFNFTELQKNILFLPEVKTLEFQKQLLKYNLHIVRSEVLPTLAIQGSYNWTTDDYNRPLDNWDDRNTWSVVLSWPLFNGGATFARYKQAKENVEQVEIGLKSTIDGMRLQLNSLYSTYIQLKDSLEISKQSLDLAQENYTVAKSYYLDGRSSYVELLQAELNFSSTKINYYQTLTDFLVVVEKLNRFAKIK